MDLYRYQKSKFCNKLYQFNEQFYCRTYCTVSKTRYTVLENQKTKVSVCPEEGKTRHGMLDLDDGAVEELLFGWFEG